MTKHAKIAVFLVVIAVLGGAYYATVVRLNISQKRKYNSCIKDSITNEEAKRFNYVGGIRDDTAKTCSLPPAEVLTEPKSSIFIP